VERGGSRAAPDGLNERGIIVLKRFGVALVLFGLFVACDQSTVGPTPSPALGTSTPVDVPGATLSWPTAEFSFVCSPKRCKFNAQKSQDDVGVVRYDWSWGDGTVSIEGSVREEHVYTRAGQYVVQLTVYDSEGQFGRAFADVFVFRCPGC
jgi:hypothetical protein